MTASTNRRLLEFGAICLGLTWVSWAILGLLDANLDNGATPSVQSSLIRASVLWIPFAFCCACIWTAICGRRCKASRNSARPIATHSVASRAQIEAERG